MTKESSSPPKNLLDKPVFYIASAILAVLVLLTSLFPGTSGEFFSTLQADVVTYASWYYVLVTAFILVCVITMASSRMGKLKLGADDSVPEYGNLSWFAMLFSAGMGIGLMFFGVAEPVMHYLSPPQIEGQSIAAAKEAMRLTFFHWGLHAWAIYAIVGLVLGYFAYRRGLPLTLRSALYPIIGEKIYGPWGAAIDVFAIIGTTCGIATSLGLGVIQINSGLNHVFGLQINASTQVVLIAAIMSIATLSVMLGLDRGIKRLSQFNMTLAVLLLLFVVLAGPTVFVLQAFVQNSGDYLSHIVSKTFNLYAYEPTDWIGGWTILYWGWWLSWAPFVGLFFARISKGRTIREFVTGAMLVPCLFTLLWMSVFGTSAIEQIMSGDNTNLADAVQSNQAIALFSFFDALPWSFVLSVLALSMVVVFFVTSADSGALVLNMLSSQGNDGISVKHRIYWTAAIGLVTISLLYAGGLSALQTACIVGALPFSIALLIATFGLFKELRMEATDSGFQRETSSNESNHNEWRLELNRLFSSPTESEIRAFFSENVEYAMMEFAEELKKYGVESRIKTFDERAASACIEVLEQGKDRFVYKVSILANDDSDAFLSSNVLEQTSVTQVELVDGQTLPCIFGWSRDQICFDIAQKYKEHLKRA